MDEFILFYFSDLLDAIDTSSIIKNKEVTKEYWEKRMMAEQSALITFESHGTNFKDNKAAKIYQISVNEIKTIDNENSSSASYLSESKRKLGSDGESEDSPESSLSPVDVDSLEGKLGVGY